MQKSYIKFYRNFYTRTGGFIPTAPLNNIIFPGDFFQVKNGEMIVLGNIFRNNVVGHEDVEFGKGIKLNPAGWNFSDGISKPYSGRGSAGGPGEDFEFSKQVIAFSSEGSFFFKANNPESVKILNWSDLAQQLIVKMTQTIFSFRELYLVTEAVTTSDWTLAISGSDKGELEIATDSENSGLADIFGHHAAKTIQSKDIEYYHRETKRKPVFFRAKKMVVQDEKQEAFISQLVSQGQNKEEWARSFFDYEFYENQADSSYIPMNQICVLDMLQANELNANTAAMYFKWADANLDDVEKLFLT